MHVSKLFHLILDRLCTVTRLLSHNIGLTNKPVLINIDLVPKIPPNTQRTQMDLLYTNVGLNHLNLNITDPANSFQILNHMMIYKNSTGVYVGSIGNNTIEKIYDSITSPQTLTTEQSVSIINGFVTLSNTTGVFIGKSFDDLVRVGR